MHSGTGEILDAPLDRPREEGEDRTNLIVNYLPQAMTDNELYSMFITCGPLHSAKIMRDKSSGYSYGYGFVQYQNPEDAAKALNTLSGLPVSNKRIKVSYSRPNTAEIRDTNLYVGNVPADISEEELLSLFHPYGNILTKNVLKDNTGKNKGIAFIRFSKKAEAMDAIKNVNGYSFPGSSTSLDVKVAEDHGRQKAAFYTGYSLGHQAAQNGALDVTGTMVWRGGRGGGGSRGRGASGGQSRPSPAIVSAFPQELNNQGFGYGFVGQNGTRGGGNRFNPMSRGGGVASRGGMMNPIGKQGSGAMASGTAGWGTPGYVRGRSNNYVEDAIGWN